MKRFNKLILAGVKEGYSDIHISGDHPVVCRKNGMILFRQQERYSPEQIDALCEQLLGENELEMLRSRLSVDLARSVAHIRVRINVFCTTRGLSMAIRLLPGRIPNISDLNLYPDLKDYCSLESGLILVCGATGSGKSSTIAALLSEINRHQKRHIITLEDPVEYRFNSVKSYIEQRELGTHMHSFDQGLRDVLREDPDVIMVGELREPETIRLTLNAVESGHLVIASLHATNSEDALYRMCNSFAPDAQDMVRTQVSSVLSLLVVQRLKYIEEAGFRVPILSILRGTNSLKATIRDNRFAQIESILQTGRAEGMFTMEKYEQDYIMRRGRLTPPSISFKPSPESADSRLYRSSLVEGRQRSANDVPVISHSPQESPAPKARVQPDMGCYVINDDSTMEDVISELDK